MFHRSTCRDSIYVHEAHYKHIAVLLRGRKFTDIPLMFVQIFFIYEIVF